MKFPRATRQHRLFFFISMNWRATRLVSYRVIIDLIGATTTKTGLSVRCELDPTEYPRGIAVSDAEMEALNLVRDSFHGEWNYTIRPQTISDRAVIPWQALRRKAANAAIEVLFDICFSIPDPFIRLLAFCFDFLLRLLVHFLDVTALVGRPGRLRSARCRRRR